MLKKFSFAFLMTAAFPLMGWNYLEECRLTGGVGYREDRLDWNIAATSGSPNVLSELKWKDIRSLQYSLKGEAITHNSIYLGLEGDYAEIYDGKHTDHDYVMDNREGLVSYSTASAGAGELYDVSGSIGFVFRAFCDQLELIPQIGYSLNEQRLQQYNGYQVYYDAAFDPNPVDFDVRGPIVGLHSNYRAKWKGPWVGLDTRFKYNTNLFLLGVEYHVNEYEGLGYWNLRNDFAGDFKHTGWGQGIKVKGGIEFCLDTRVTFGIFGSYTYYRLSNGLDRTFFYDTRAYTPPGSLIPIVEGRTKVNQVHWHSFTIQGTLTYYF